MILSAPGIYAISAAAYHADPCPTPSLSRSVGKVLLSKSPRHAWHAHPRLNPDWQPDDDTKFDVGKAAHDLLLRGEGDIDVIDADSWRTKAAKEARDVSLAGGRLPILATKWAHVQAMVRAGRAQLDVHEDAADAFTDGRPEMTLVWREGETWCRIRLDWLPDKGSTFYDFKSTVNAHPDAWAERACYETGSDLQAAFYRRGIRALGIAKEPLFKFVVQEVEPPYALSVCALPPAALDMADRKVETMIELWRWCVAKDAWPGYPARTVYADPPPWHERRWLERETREELAREAGEDLKARLLRWYAPVDAA